MTEVAILGCGPAGLLAAHAAVQAGAIPRIFSKKEKSPVPGAQFLHVPIPGLTEEMTPRDIYMRKVGRPEIYARKVYGRENAETSWGGYAEGVHQVYDLKHAYQLLWEMFVDNIVDLDIQQHEIRDLSKHFPWMFSTIPATALCPVYGVSNDACQFRRQPVSILHGQNWAYSYRLDDMTIEYNGTKESAWYRRSNIFGWSSAEFNPVDAPEMPDDMPLIQIHKPLWTNCTHHHHIIRLGRYGLWKKGVLVHHAYKGALEALLGSAGAQ